MTYVATDGPPSLDATHAWAPATGSAPPTLNSRGSDPPTLPWIKVRQIANWRGAPEADDFREARSAIDGEIGYPGRLLGKTVVYECEIRAATRETVQGRLTAVLNGFGDRFGLGTMLVTPFASPGGVAWEFQARVLLVDPDPAWTYLPGAAGPYRWGFALSLRMLNPRFYTPNLAGAAYL